MLFFHGNLLPAFLLLGFLTSCAGQQAEPAKEQSVTPETVAAVSVIGDELVIDVIARSVIRGKDTRLDVSSWRMNDGFRSLLESGAAARGKEARSFRLDPQALEKVLHLRENRWRKTVGRYNQALLDFLFREAQAQGIRHFFLLTKIDAPERFPLHKGSAGIYCADLKGKIPRAYAYFGFDFSFWNVAERKRAYQQEVNPGLTQEMQFADCKEVVELKDPVDALKEPVLHTMELLVEKLFANMHWEKKAP